MISLSQKVCPSLVDWNLVDTVLLDMDGTLLDLKFDNDFWLQRVPEAYALKQDISVDAAREALYPRLRALKGTLDWYCIEFWSDELGLDIAAMKRRYRSDISLRDGAVGFLSAVQGSGRPQYLVTNAHGVTVDIKMAETGIAHFFTELITSHRFNAPKEQPEFWERLVSHTGLNLGRCLFIDDTAAVLESARACGVGQVIGVTKPDSSRPINFYQEFTALESYEAIMPS